MRKVLALLLTFLFVTLTAYGVHKDPVKWYTMPINVYIPAHSKAPLMKKAFLDLQNNSGNTIKFRFLNEQGQKRAHISVSFVQKCNYENAVGLTYQNTKKRAYLRNTIKVGLLNPDTNKKYSDKTLYIIMLHEAGHAIGMEHSGDSADIMYPTLNKNQQSLTKNDLNQIKRLYAY